ncbi:sialoadhesin-like [Genypterus blacodes]|uniref:sialoadhesin-like n=1 Tax=Genypterus blacodes TaxID=154954 RepID=UPI003F76AF76
MENVIVVILVIMPGVWSGAWTVNLNDQCALKGTSVVMSCTYDYPFGVIVTSLQWFKSVYDSGKWTIRPVNDISPDPGHFQYLGNKWKNCAMRINAVQNADAGEYFFKFWTTLGSYMSKTAYLSITELTAVVKPASVTEGKEVHLSCEWNCASSHPSVVWFRDEQPIRNSVFQATAKDAGRFSCAAQGSEASRSAPVALNVQYRPKEVTLSLSPSAIIRGSSVDFTCSSDANPVVTQSGYSVYKDGQLTSTGQKHTISNIQPAHSGQYYCQAQNGISVSKSPEVNLDVKYLPENVSVSMDPVNVVEGSSVNLTCSSDANPAADSFTWYWRAAAPESSSVLLEASGQVLSLSPVQESQPGLYLCQARNTLGGNNSTELLLEMKINKGLLICLSSHPPGCFSTNNLSLPVMAGVGVTLLLALLVALLWFWKKKQADKQQTVNESRLSGRGSSSSAIEMQNDSLYGNIQVFSTSPPSLKTAQEIPHYTAKPHHTGQQSKDEEEAIIYSTVTIKPKALHDTQPNSGDTGDSVTFKMMENVIVVILVNMAGVWSGDWKVNLKNQCAIRGTSVVMSCTYDYPYRYSIRSVQWLKRVQDSGNWIDMPVDEISSDPDHFQYLGNKRRNCTMRINAVQNADAGGYLFRFKTTRYYYMTWTSKRNAYLSITELTAVVKPASVTEGEEVHMSCEWNCSSSHPSVVWFRDEQPIWKSVFHATAKDAGWYSCAAQGSEASRSAPVALNVQYRPKEVTLSLSPSAIIRGSSVDFTCSSDANPVVTQSGYSVYKDGQLTSTGQKHTIANIQPADSGQYYCQAQNGISVSKSPEVNLDVKYLPENVSVSMDPVNVVEGSSVNLTCSSDANPAADSFTWYWRAAAPESSSVLLEASGQVLSLSPVQESQPGLYLCQARNTLGGNNSTELLLEMKINKGLLICLSSHPPGCFSTDNLSLPVMAGVGVTLLLALLVALLWFWKKKQADKQQTVNESRLSGRGSSSSAIEMQNDSLYGNIQVFSTSPPSLKTAQEIPHYTAKPHHTGQQSKDEEEAIIYSTVTIKPKALHDTQPNSGDTGDSVIYSTVAKTS